MHLSKPCQVEYDRIIYTIVNILHLPWQEEREVVKSSGKWEHQLKLGMQRITKLTVRTILKFESHGSDNFLDQPPPPKSHIATLRRLSHATVPTYRNSSVHHPSSIIIFYRDAKMLLYTWLEWWGRLFKFFCSSASYCWLINMSRHVNTWLLCIVSLQLGIAF